MNILEPFSRPLSLSLGTLTYDPSQQLEVLEVERTRLAKELDAKKDEMANRRFLKVSKSLNLELRPC